MTVQRYTVTPQPIETLLHWIKSREIAIPEIQRPFVWEATDVRNFLDCVKSRRRPVLDADAGHFVSTVAHLGNIAYRTGQKIVWDGDREKVTSHKSADKLVGVKYRRPRDLPFGKRE